MNATVAIFVVSVDLSKHAFELPAGDRHRRIVERSAGLESFQVRVR